MSCGCRGGLCIGLLPRWGRCVFVWLSQFILHSMHLHRQKYPRISWISGSHPQRDADAHQPPPHSAHRAQTPSKLCSTKCWTALRSPSLPQHRFCTAGLPTSASCSWAILQSVTSTSQSSTPPLCLTVPPPRDVRERRLHLEALFLARSLLLLIVPHPLAAAQGQLAVSSASGMSTRGPRGETITPARRSPTGAIATATDPTRALSTLCAYSRTGTTSWAMELRSTT